MDDFINVIKECPLVCVKTNYMLDRYNRLSYNHKIEIVHNNLSHIVILKGLINKMATMITDLDMELKIKIRRIKYLESRT